jgi:hypothetical protein
VRCASTCACTCACMQVHSTFCSLYRTIVVLCYALQHTRPCCKACAVHVHDAWQARYPIHHTSLTNGLVRTQLKPFAQSLQDWIHKNSNTCLAISKSTTPASTHTHPRILQLSTQSVGFVPRDLDLSLSCKDLFLHLRKEKGCTSILSSCAQFPPLLLSS